MYTLYTKTVTVKITKAGSENRYKSFRKKSQKHINIVVNVGFFVSFVFFLTKRWRIFQCRQSVSFKLRFGKFAAEFAAKGFFNRYLSSLLFSNGEFSNKEFKFMIVFFFFSPHYPHPSHPHLILPQIKLNLVLFSNQISSSLSSIFSSSPSPNLIITIIISISRSTISVPTPILILRGKMQSGKCRGRISCLWNGLWG